ncbi:Uncharacterised protein [Serratia plymuthica]|nr:Uncharacterised protein [Serratia plymuthica]
MREPISLELAEYRSGLACSLYEVIMELACNESSKQLLDLLSLACDINHEVHCSLEAATGVTHG